MMYAFKLTTLLCCFSVSLVSGQLYLDNASFEGEPQDATTPVGWHPCAEHSTPDILPGPWGVFEEASDGDTFVGLINRADGSYESIGQRLPKTVKKGECYEFSLDLARSITYSDYNKPLKLRIWAGTYKCNADQLILDTDPIEHNEWKAYPVQFYAKQDLNYIILEAFHQKGSRYYQGNILIDRIRPLRKCARADLGTVSP